MLNKSTGLKPTDPAELKEMQTNELNTGRLAMIGIAGMIVTWGQTVLGRALVIMCHFRSVTVIPLVVVRIQPTQKLKAKMANPTIRRFLIHYFEL